MPQITGAMQYFQDRFEAGSFSRDTSLASGTQDFSVSFMPSFFLLFVNQSDSSEISWGWQVKGDAAKYCMYDINPNSANNYSITTAFSLYDFHAAGATYTGTITTFGTTSTVSWTKTGSPTGTIKVHWMAFR